MFRAPSPPPAPLTAQAAVADELQRQAAKVAALEAAHAEALAEATTGAAHEAAELREASERAAATERILAEQADELLAARAEAMAARVERDASLEALRAEHAEELLDAKARALSAGSAESGATAEARALVVASPREIRAAVSRVATRVGDGVASAALVGAAHRVRYEQSRQQSKHLLELLSLNTKHTVAEMRDQSRLLASEKRTWLAQRDRLKKENERLKKLLGDVSSPQKCGATKERRQRRKKALSDAFDSASPSPPARRGAQGASLPSTAVRTQQGQAQGQGQAQTPAPAQAEALAQGRGRSQSYQSESQSRSRSQSPSRRAQLAQQRSHAPALAADPGSGSRAQSGEMYRSELDTFLEELKRRKKRGEHRVGGGGSDEERGAPPPTRGGGSWAGDEGDEPPYESNCKMS